MVFTMKHLFLCIVFYVSSTCLASNTNETPSKITVKENFNSPVIMNPVSPYGPPPIVSNFVHQGTNFFFNPHFLLGTNIPPPLGAVVAAIPSSIVEVDVNETVIPPKIEVIVEEPNEVIVPLPSPPQFPVISQVPKVPVLLPEMPPAPILPPLVLPKIPIWVEETVEVVPACEEKEVIVTEVKPLPPVIIPQAPSLPPLVLPPKILVSEIEVKTPEEPSIIEVPVVMKTDVTSGFSKVKLTNQESLQLIPRSPVAEIDIKINEISGTNKLSEIEKLFSIGEDKTVIMVPSCPDLTGLEIPKAINEVLVIEKGKNIGLSTPVPTECARNIVLERVLPNMISKKTVTKSLEIISFPVV